jgi:hypothetical protein
MITKTCFDVNYCPKDQNLDSTDLQSDQLLHTLVKHRYQRITVQKLMRFGRKILRKI